MKKQAIITWGILILLTIVSALISNFYYNGNYFLQIIIVFAVLKFIGVVFSFMELHKAHNFWKITVLAFLFLFSIVIFMM